MVNKADSAIIIPKDVIQSNRRVKYCLYRREEHGPCFANSRPGLEDDKNIQILEGLKENDNLVVKGFETLKENAKVKFRKMKSIIKFAVSNPVTICMLVLAILLLGKISYDQLAVDLLPDPNNPPSLSS